jgi:hypothetical protein
VAFLAVMQPRPLAPLLLWNLSGKSPQDTYPLVWSGVGSDSFRFEWVSIDLQAGAKSYKEP